MPIKYDLNNLTTNLANVGPRLEEKAAQIVQETVIDGANQMRQNIEASGRIDTGYMLGDVANNEVQTDGGTVHAEFGWGTTGGPVQPYYVYQEQGFTHYGSGKDVPPMHALLQAFINVREKFYAKIAAL